MKKPEKVSAEYMAHLDMLERRLLATVVPQEFLSRGSAIAKFLIDSGFGELLPTVGERYTTFEDDYQPGQYFYIFFDYSRHQRVRTGQTTKISVFCGDIKVNLFTGEIKLSEDYRIRDEFISTLGEWPYQVDFDSTTDAPLPNSDLQRERNVKLAHIRESRNQEWRKKDRKTIDPLRYLDLG